MRNFIILGSINMALSVALGAFGAHILKALISPEMLDIYQTANHYHMIHGLGILLVAFMYGKLNQSSLINWSGWLLFVGIVIFSGSLYVLSITQIKILGAITPIGGVAFISGWILLAFASLQKQ